MASNLLLADVNVLLALAWPNHQFHPEATERLADRNQRLATCALTQLGLVRLSSNPAAGLGRKTVAECAALVEAITQDPGHVYLDNLPCLAAEGFTGIWPLLAGYRQVTDAYLVRLAHHHHATLLTFDARLGAIAPPGSVEVLRPHF